MNPFDALLAKFNLNLSEGVKTTILIGAGLVLAFIALGFLKTSFEQAFYKGAGTMGMSAPSFGMPIQPGRGEMMKMEMAEYDTRDSAVADMPAFSTRNAAGIYPPQPGMSTGNTAEEFEVSDYSASIETVNLKKTCGEITELKSKKEVIFESASESESHCFFSFKVEHSATDMVLSVLKTLEPRDLSQSTYTIKEQLEDFTSQAEILQKKLVAIEETLSGALAAYDEVARLATRSQDAEALASIINNKVMTIERLTQERISINQQLEYLARAKSQAADKLNYAFFSVTVYENEYIDGKALADSWKAAVQKFFLDANLALQGITITLVSFILLVLQYLLYALLLVFAVKYGWKAVQAIWKK
jgi:hypothetical protein